jgi:hypothetical protein
MKQRSMKPAFKHYDWNSCSYEEKERFLDWLLNKRPYECNFGEYCFSQFIVKTLDHKSNDYDIFLSDWDHPNLKPENIRMIPKLHRREYFEKQSKVINTWKEIHGYSKFAYGGYKDIKPRLIFGIEKIWTLHNWQIREKLNRTEAQQQFPHLLAMTEEERVIALKEKKETDYVIKHKKMMYSMLERELYEIIAKFEKRKRAKELEEERKKTQQVNELKANIHKILSDEDMDPDW